MTNDTATSSHDEAVADAARRLAEAELATEAATGELRAAEAECDRIRSRVAGMDARRREIGRRRQEGGDLREADGAELALLAADAEALAEIGREHDAAVAAARAEDRRTEAALTETSDRLEALLLEAVVQNIDVARRLGRGQPAWCPSEALMRELTPLHLRRRQPWQ